MDFKLETFLPYRLNQAAERVSQRFAAQYRSRYKMTRPEWRALAALGSYGCMTATEIGANSSMHKTKVSRAVRALEEKRWLKRSEDAGDRRFEHLELTPAGRRIFTEMIELAHAYERELAQLLGAGASINWRPALRRSRRNCRAWRPCDLPANDGNGILHRLPSAGSGAR